MSARLLRLPLWTVRLRLTLLYSGLFLISGLALLVTTYLLFRHSTGVDLIVQGGSHRAGLSHRVEEMYIESVRRNHQHLHEGLMQSAIALAILTLISVALGWLVAGRVLRPLRAMTATTRQISERNLNERLALSGPRDELKDLADTVDGLLARLEDHVGAQQRFAANASHELRTPLAITQSMLDVARADPDRAEDDLLDHLHQVNARAINLTEALLLLSRAGQRAFTREPVDLSLIAEEAAEALLPLAEQHGISVRASVAPAPATGSRALLLQLAINLIQNAIVHNLPEGGTVWVTVRAHADGAELAVENTGQQLSQQAVATLVEPFQRGTERARSTDAGVGLGLAIVNSIAQAHDGALTLTARPEGGLRVTVRLPGRPG